MNDFVENYYNYCYGFGLPSGEKSPRVVTAGGGSRAYYIIHLCRPFAASSVLLLFYYVLFSSQTVHLPRCIERRFPRFSANCFETDFTVVHYWANARRGVEET